MRQYIDILIDRLKSRSVHTPRIAIARFLLAFGMLLTLFTNDLSVVANHNYTKLPDYQAMNKQQARAPFKQVNLFRLMAPDKAKVVVIIILLIVMTGLLPQVTGVLHFWACFSIHNYFILYNGGDELAYVLSLLLLPICLTDPRINQWKRVGRAAPSQRNIVAGIALFVIHIQAALVYFDASVSKFVVKEWRDGTAVYYYTSHYRLGAVGWLQRINEWITLSPAVYLLTWGVLALELVLAGCLFFPWRIRKKLIIPALLFHLLIAINMGLISFFFSIAALIVLYLYNDTARATRI